MRLEPISGQESHHREGNGNSMLFLWQQLDSNVKIDSEGCREGLSSLGMGPSDSALFSSTATLNQERVRISGKPSARDAAFVRARPSGFRSRDV